MLCISCNLNVCQNKKLELKRQSYKPQLNLFDKKNGKVTKKVAVNIFFNYLICDE